MMPAKPIITASNRETTCRGVRSPYPMVRPVTKGKIKSLIYAPALYVPDQKPGPDHCEKNAGQDRPDHANKPKEFCEEDAPQLP